MSAGHTPGPWSVEAFNEVFAGEPDYASFIVGPDGESILAQQISDANARLIAAAPEMLDVLQTVHDYAGDVARGEMVCLSYSGDLRKMAAEDLARIKAAIAKAAGPA